MGTDKIFKLYIVTEYKIVIKSGKMVSAVEEESKTTEVIQAKSEDVVAELEEQFKDRYTENDPEYKAVLEMKEPSPSVIPNFGYPSHDRSTSSSDRTSRNEERSSNKRSRSRSRSKSPIASLKRKGMFGCQSYFVFYY